MQSRFARTGRPQDYDRRPWRWRPVAAVLAIVAIASGLALASTAGASTSTRTEHFSFIDTSINQTSVAYSAIATGGFTAGGTATKNGAVFTMQFPSGTITLNVKTSHSHKTESPTCFQSKTSAGNYKISGGTGTYQGISGSGSATVNVTIVETPTNGTCPESQDAAQAIVLASGPVSLR
jgi:hypothetical protein